MKTLSVAAVFLLPLLLSAGIVHAQTSDALFIDTDGKVGIGNSNPRQALDVSGGISTRSTHFVFDSREAVINWGNETGGILRFRRLHKQGDINYYNGKELLTISDSGNVVAAGTIKDRTGYVTPTGGIIMWSGTKDVFDASGKGKAGTAVEGWAICNGLNNTPYLCDRFIVAAGMGSTKYKVGDAGGKDMVTLTTNEMPAHSHGALITCFKSSGEWNKAGPAALLTGDHGGSYVNTAKAGYADCGQTSTEGKSFVQDNGNGAAFDNRPLYYALLYIMKL